MNRTRSVSYATFVAQRFPWRPQCQWIHSKSHLVGTSNQTVVELKQPKPMSFRDIPGATMLENLQKYRKYGVHNHHIIQVELFEKYGPIFKFKMPGKSMVCACDPDDIEKVFRAEGYPASRGEEFLVGLSSYFALEKGLEKGMIGNDESWYSHRSAVGSKVLRPVALRTFVSDLCTVTDDTIGTFNDGRNPDVLPELMKWSTESIGVVMFGQRLGVNAVTPNKMALDFIQSVCSFLVIEAKLHLSFPFHKYFKTPTMKRLYRSFDVLWDVTDYYVQKVREDLDSSKAESVVQQLIHDGKLSQDEIIQISLNMFSGGVDTTSNAILNVLYLLSEFPEAQKKLYEEIEHTLPNTEMPTHNDIGNMPYLKGVIKESARMHPTVPGTIRELKETIILSGYEIPPGTVIFLSFFASSLMNYKNFGADFEKFNPNRWLREAVKPPPFAWTRFGFGPRMCLGKRVAELEMALFLIRLLQKYEIEVRRPEEDKMEWVFKMLVNAAKPFNMNLKKREN